MVRRSIGQKLLHEGEHLAARMRDVLGHQPQLRVRHRLGAVTEQLGAHVHAAQMVLEVVGEDAEQFIPVLGELLQLVAGLFERQVGADARHQFGVVEGLGDVVHAAAFQGANDQALVVGRGKENDRNLSPIGFLPDSPANLESVHLRHQKVEQDEVGPANRQPLEGLEPAGRGQNLETEFAQGGADDLDVGLLVIYDEQAAHVCFYVWGIHFAS